MRVCVCMCMLKYIIKSRKIKCYDTETYKYMLCRVCPQNKLR